MNQTADQAYEFLVKLAENSQNWSSSRKDLERDEIGIQKPGMYNIKQDPELKNVMTSLVQGVENLSKKIGSMSVMSCQPTPQQHEPTLRSMGEPHHVCVLCDSCEHMVESCPSLPFVMAEQVNVLDSYGNFWKLAVNPFN